MTEEEKQRIINQRKQNEAIANALPDDPADAHICDGCQ
jgi:hypothetical protein